MGLLILSEPEGAIKDFPQYSWPLTPPLSLRPKVGNPWWVTVLGPCLFIGQSHLPHLLSMDGEDFLFSFIFPLGQQGVATWKCVCFADSTLHPLVGDDVELGLANLPGQ